MSKSAAPGDGDGSFANIANTIVTKTARQKKFRFTELIQEASNTDVDLKTLPTDDQRTLASYTGQQTPVAGAQHESVVDKVPTTAIAGLAGRVRRFEQHARCGSIVRYRTNVIGRGKEIFVAVFDSNFGTKVERNHPANLFEDFQEFRRRHVFVSSVRWHPKLDDRFLPTVGLSPAIDRFERGCF